MEVPYLQQILFKRATDLIAQGDYIEALEVTEELSFVKGKDRAPVDFLQGRILSSLGKKTEKGDVKFTYLLGSVESFSTSLVNSAAAAVSLFELAQQLESALYYRSSLRKAKERVDSVQNSEYMKQIIETAESKIAESKNSVVGSLVKNWEREENEEETRKSGEADFVKGLRSYWRGLNVEVKRNFMKVSTADFTSYVERVYGGEGRDALEKVLTSAREDKRWRFWICRTCSKKFSVGEECTNHFEQEHGADYKPRLSKAIPQRISKAWARKIQDGGWEPVDAVAAVEKIKNRLEDVKAFAYVNGWSKDWPLATDEEERGKLLQEIRLLLVSFYDHKILPCSVRDWVMHFVVNHLEKLEVSKDTLTDCRLMETPQSICFLECSQLNQILEFLRNIKCERDDGTDLVRRAVDSFYSGTQVKERIDFDIQFSFLLLDKRLLQGKIARFDDDGTINLVDPNDHYAKAHAHGDDILSWLTDYCPGDESFRFPRPISAHNLDIWLAVLRAVQFTCRTLGAKHGKTLKLGHFDEVLENAKNLCISEDERRRNIRENQWNRYASLLCDDCEKLLMEARDSRTTKLHLSAVRDVLKGASHPTIEYPDLERCLNTIRELKNVSDDIVLKSIDHLKLAATYKVPLIDSKILLIEHSRINLLKYLTRLSVYDYRSYILPPLKEFLLDGIVNMESKAKLAAAEADLLLEDGKRTWPTKKKNKSSKEELDGTVNMDAKAKIKENEKNSGSKKNKHRSIKEGIVDVESKSNLAAAEAILLLAEEKKSQSKEKHRSKKRASTRTSSPLDKTIEHENSANLEREEDSVEPGCQLETSSTIDNQEEAVKDMQNMPGPSEHSESALGEAPARYNSALDMTLKALCNIKVLKEYLVHNRHQFRDNLEERVPLALRNFFTAFVSKQIKEEGVYSCLLSDLLASLEEAHSMSNDASELLISILEFWPCWKIPETESVVTRIFTLEEYERMSCSKCGKKPNYPEQSSYGVVMAADSIRDLKCALGNLKFEDILKVIRMEEKMLCEVKTGGCGKANFVHHIISRCPLIFTIVLEWEKNETGEEISETTNALSWEIDISRLYEDLEPDTKYRLVSMIGCGEEEEEEHICLAYKKNRWVSFRHEASGKKVVVGNWESLVRFCGDRKVRLKILFYEAFNWPNN